MVETTKHGTLVAKRDGIYTTYVFQLDDNSYLMCTKLPNWGDYDLNIGSSGFITTQAVNAGEQYYDRKTDTQTIFLYTNVYFKEFIKDNNTIKDIIV